MNLVEAAAKSPANTSRTERSNSKRADKSQSTINDKNTDFCVDNGHSNGDEELSSTISNIDKDKVAKIKKIKTVSICF